MYSRFYATVLYPATLRFRRDRTLCYLRGLESSQWWERAELEKVQYGKLRELLTHCERRSKFYREKWRKSGIKANAVGSLDHLALFPLVTKSDLRSAGKNALADRPYRLTNSSTGGSTGEPFRFAFDEKSAQRRAANSHRAYGWAGADLGVKRLYLWGQALSKGTVARRVTESLRSMAQRRRIVGCFHFGPREMEQFSEVWRSYEPDVLVAYVNPLYEFCRYLEEKGVGVPVPRSIVVGAERLYDFQRAKIERVLQAPVFETYGSREFLVIAAECPQHEGLHISAENLIVEVVDDDGRPCPDGTEGNVVITDLTNYGMPFVRYANGDRAIAGFGRCSCGRGLPLLRGLRGRKLDIIVGEDGRRIPGEFFPHLMKDLPFVKRFQVVQKNWGGLEVNVVGDRVINKSELAGIVAQIRIGTGWALGIEVRQVDEIPLTGAGKLKVVVREFEPEATSGPGR